MIREKEQFIHHRKHKTRRQNRNRTHSCSHRKLRSFLQIAGLILHCKQKRTERLRLASSLKQKSERIRKRRIEASVTNAKRFNESFELGGLILKRTIQKNVSNREQKQRVGNGKRGKQFASTHMTLNGRSRR